jgi:hypothetical protein
MILSPGRYVGYRWWTCGYHNQADWDAWNQYLKIGPATVCWWKLSSGHWCIEVHWLNRLLLAVPDWRVVGL